LVETRKRKRLTQAVVAERLGKPQSYVSKYESGERRLDVVEFLDIVAVLGIRPAKLLGRLGVS
jgi:transcriptional regulator with XRE-family HTH domain